jgi:hypothetical protein
VARADHDYCIFVDRESREVYTIPRASDFSNPRDYLNLGSIFFAGGPTPARLLEL